MGGRWELVTDAGGRVLRTAPWLVALVGVASVLFVAGALFTYVDDGWSLTTLCFVVLSGLGFVGLIDSLTCRVIFDDDALRVVSFWGRKTYPTSEISSVKWQWGTGVFLKLHEGGWAKLPELGRNSQSIANTVRAWLKRNAGGS